MLNKAAFSAFLSGLLKGFNSIMGREGHLHRQHNLNHLFQRFYQMQISSILKLRLPLA